MEGERGIVRPDPGMPSPRRERARRTEPSAPPAAPPRRLGWRFALAGLAALVLLYARGLGGGFVNDDRTMFVENDLLPALGPGDLGRLLTGGTNYWGDVQPARDLLWMAELALFGRSTPGWHLVSLALYAATCALAFHLARSVAAGGPRPAPLLGVDGADVSAAIVTVLFAAHPVHVEGVAYVFGQKDVLSAAFTLGALLALKAAVDDPARRARAAAAGVALFYLALLAKQTAIVVLALVPLLWALADPSRRPPLRRALPAWALVAVPAVLWTAYTRAVWAALFRVNSELSATPLAGRLPVALKVLGAHTLLVLRPAGLSFGYPFDGSAAADANLAAGAVTLLVLGGLTVRFRRDAAVVLGAAIYLLFLVPVLQLHGSMDNASVYDRYLFLSVLGAAMLLERALRGLPVRRAAQAGIAGAVAAAWAAISFAYVPAFADDVAATRNAHEKHPGWPRAAFDHACALVEAGRLDEAGALLAREPSFASPPWVRDHLGGWIALERGDLEAAVPMLTRAWVTASAGGYYPFPAVPLARALVRVGRLAHAEEVLRAALASPIYQPLEAYRARKLLESVLSARAGGGASAPGGLR
jgi:hypothetical protein